ncbi:MAG: hypothetical protein AAGC57_07910 [Pseudomonadota bacterium]
MCHGLDSYTPSMAARAAEHRLTANAAAAERERRWVDALVGALLAPIRRLWRRCATVTAPADMRMVPTSTATGQGPEERG